MVMRSFLALLVCCGTAAFAQAPLPYAGKGLLKASATISPGFMLSAPVTDTYVSAGLEYFTEDRISFRAEGLWFMESPEEHPLLLQNSQLAFGPFYHITKGRADLGLGLEVGINFASPGGLGEAEERDVSRVVPSAVLCANFTWAVWDYFHFFANVHYVHARYTGSYNGEVPLDEIVLGGGLGWQLRVK